MVDELEEWAQEGGGRDAALADLERKLHVARDQAVHAKRALKLRTKELETAERRFDALARIKEPVEVVRIKRPRLKKGGRSRAIAGSIASDWHVGEMVSYGQTNGLNEYNPELAKERADNYFARALWCVEKERSAVDIDTYVLALLGDLMTGFIHEDLRLTNALSPTEEVRYLKQLLIAGIDHLLEYGEFRRIVVPCVWGNHGRTTDREMIGAAARNSYEWMAYMDLADHYAAEDRLDFQIAQGLQIYLNIEGFIIGCAHGNHGFGYSGGVGGISIPLRKYLMRQAKGIPAHLTLLGHWHTYLDMGDAIVNGSNIGFNAFAAGKMFEPEPAQQAFFSFSPKHHRRLMGAPLFVEEPELWAKRRAEVLQGG